MCMIIVKNQPFCFKNRKQHIHSQLDSRTFRIFFLTSTITSTVSSSNYKLDHYILHNWKYFQSVLEKYYYTHEIHKAELTYWLMPHCLRITSLIIEIFLFCFIAFSQIFAFMFYCVLEEFVLSIFSLISATPGSLHAIYFI